MKSKLIRLMFLVLPAAVLLSGCARTADVQPIVESRFIDVYINEECLPSTLAKGGLIETLWLFPDDRVVVTNTRDKAIDIKFPAGMFDKDEVTIEPGKRVILTVQKTGPQTGAFSLADDIVGHCPDGTPKVQVGEDP